ncbi:MAG: sulfatase-like hydrolase/transferase, partial [Dermabacteraceae bacterium]
MNRPNILWISTHDINPHLGTYAGIWPGAEQARTPNLDRLAAQGARFDRAYASAPVCAPSRSAIITGCHPTSIGTMHMRSNAVLPEEIRLLPELLREAGYYTTNNWFRDFQTEAPGTAFDDDSSTAHWRGRPEGAPFFAAFHGLITHESQIYLDSEALREASPHVAD